MTCGQLYSVTDSFTCDAATQLGCNCGDCCLPSPPPTPCKARVVRNVFKGTGLEGGGEEEVTKSLEFHSEFTDTFYNMTCLSAGGSGDPCHVHEVEECAPRQRRLGR